MNSNDRRWAQHVRNRVGRSSRYFEHVTTWPRRESWDWPVGGFSPLSFVTLYAISFAKLLSPLQHIKGIYRTWIIPERNVSRTNVSGRPDIKPWLFESYMIGVCGLSVALYIWILAIARRWESNGSVGPAEFIDAVPAGRWILFLAYWLSAEGVFLVTYYGIFRPFVEGAGRFRIYHEIEYFVQLIWSFIYEVFLCATISMLSPLYPQGEPTPSGSGMRAVDLGTLATHMFGVSTVARLGLWSRLIGIIYFGVMLTYWLSVFPKQATKEGDTDDLLIVGGGDVVTKLLQAHQGRVAAGLWTFRKLNCLSFEFDGVAVALRKAALRISLIGARNADEMRRTVQGHRGPAIFASPPFARFQLMVERLRAGEPTGVEKPLGANLSQDDLRTLEHIVKTPTTRSKLFAFSYYSLEKALPFLAAAGSLPIPSRWAGYLGLSSGDLDKLNSLRGGLGALKSLEVWVLEDKDRSPRQTKRIWTELLKYGGTLYETFLHPLLLARLVHPKEEWWDFAGKEEIDTHYYRPRFQELIDKHADAVRQSMSMLEGADRAEHETLDLKSASTWFAPTYISWEKDVHEVKIALQCGKFQKATKRGAKAIFACGTVEANFDEPSASDHRRQSAVIRVGGQHMELAITDAFKGQYAIQADMFVRFIREPKLVAEPWDHALEQWKVLRWLGKRRDEKFITGSPEG